MKPYWIKFIGHKPGCVEAETAEDARRLAHELTGAEVASCDILPYPADPRLNKHEYKSGPTPSLCYDPEYCKGSTSCPKPRACSE